MISFEILKDRALMFKKARAFFSKKKILEIDAPALLQKPSIDLNIDVLKTAAFKNQTAYLHTSPEYCLKRLLAENIGDIYQMSHVFRFEERGPLHNPEFTLVEWYRQETSYNAFLEETLDFIKLFLGPLSFIKKSFRQLFYEKTGLDPFEAKPNELYLLFLDLKPDLSLPKDAVNWDKDTLLNLIMSHVIEQDLGQNELFILDEYPASQAALSQIKIKDGFPVAERFEIYFQGIELANGYHELLDAEEQKIRLEEANRQRKAAGKEELPLDEKFLKALKKSIKDCYGVAIGFDRLMMIRHKKNNLSEVLPFSFEKT